MVYVDSSVALADILSEDRRPAPEFWQQDLGSSRLLQFEILNRLHAYGAGAYMHVRAQDVLATFNLVEMTRDILNRALSPFPIPVRTLDGLHLATAHYLREQGFFVEIASYDARMIAGANALGIPTFVL